MNLTSRDSNSSENFSENIRLTFAERWILANQYRIMHSLSASPTSAYIEAITILENGFEREYQYAAQNLRTSVLPEHIAIEVHQILRMFSELQWVKDKVHITDSRHQALWDFWGFDGNTSSEHLGYASYLLERGDYAALGLSTCPDSHSDTIGTYRAMVRAWSALPTHGVRMTEAEVLTVLDGPLLEGRSLP